MSECTYQAMKNTIDIFFVRDQAYKTIIKYNDSVGYIFMPLSITRDDSITKGSLNIYAYYTNGSITRKAYAFALVPIENQQFTRSHDETFETINEFSNYLDLLFPEHDSPEQLDVIPLDQSYKTALADIVKNMRFEGALRFALNDKTAYRDVIIHDRQTEHFSDSICAHVTFSTNAIIAQWLRGEFNNQYHATNTMQRIEYTLSSLLTQ